MLNGSEMFGMHTNDANDNNVMSEAGVKIHVANVSFHHKVAKRRAI